MNKIILRDLVNIVRNKSIGFIEYVDEETRIKEIFDWTDEPGYIGDDKYFDEDYLEGLSQFVEKYGDKEVISIEASGDYDTVYYLKIKIR